MTSKEDALAEIVAIARRHNITQTAIITALKAKHDKGKDAPGIAMKLFAYLGGTFILAGIGAYISMFWGDINSFMRIVITLGSGFFLYILGLVALGDKRYERVVTPLLLVAALLQPIGLFVAIDEFSKGGDWRITGLFMFGPMVIQQGLTFWFRRRTALLFTTITFAVFFVFIFFDLIGLDKEWNKVIVGAALLYVCYHFGKTPYHVVTSFWSFIGSMMLLQGVFYLVERTPFDLLFLPLCCFLMFISTVAHSRAMLLVSTLGLLSFVAYYTDEYFVDSAGWPIALIVLGLLFFGISAMAMKIDKRYLSD